MPHVPQRVHPRGDAGRGSVLGSGVSGPSQLGLQGKKDQQCLLLWKTTAWVFTSQEFPHAITKGEGRGKIVETCKIAAKIIPVAGGGKVKNLGKR